MDGKETPKVALSKPQVYIVYWSNSQMEAPVAAEIARKRKMMDSNENPALVAESLDAILQSAYEDTHTGVHSFTCNVVEQVILHLPHWNVIVLTVGRQNRFISALDMLSIKFAESYSQSILSLNWFLRSSNAAMLKQLLQYANPPRRRKRLMRSYWTQLPKSPRRAGITTYPYGFSTKPLFVRQGRRL